MRNKRSVAVEVIFEDITKLKALEDKLSVLSRVQIIGDMTKGLLHSFNNTLNVIASRTQLLLQLTEKPAVIDGLSTIERAALDGGKQVRRVQDFIGSGNDTEETSTTDLIDVIEDAIEFAKVQFKVESTEKGRSIVIRKQYFTRAEISGDLKLLRELFIAMIFRMSRLSPGDGSLFVDLREEGELSLRVSMQKEIKGDEPSVLPDDTAFSNIDIRRVAEKLGIRLFEEEDSLTASIRAVIPNRMIAQHEKKIAEPSEINLRDKSILVVEDELALQAILRDFFDSMGNHVSICTSGTEALDDVKKNRYDIVLSDYGITGITGIELLTRVKELNENTVTVLLSGWMISDLHLYKNIVDLFLPKPFQLDVLLTEISKVLKAKMKRNPV